jgi:hypothetical protein
MWKEVVVACYTGICLEKLMITNADMSPGRDLKPGISGYEAEIYPL